MWWWERKKKLEPGRSDAFMKFCLLSEGSKDLASLGRARRFKFPRTSRLPCSVWREWQVWGTELKVIFTLMLQVIFTVFGVIVVNLPTWDIVLHPEDWESHTGQYQDFEITSKSTMGAIGWVTISSVSMLTTRVVLKVSFYKSLFQNWIFFLHQIPSFDNEPQIFLVLLMFLVLELFIFFRFSIPATIFKMRCALGESPSVCRPS